LTALPEDALAEAVEAAALSNFQRLVMLSIFFVA
jgi:hypothetical protein